MWSTSNFALTSDLWPSPCRRGGERSVDQLQEASQEPPEHVLRHHLRLLPARLGSAWASAPTASPWPTAATTTPSPGAPRPRSPRTGNHAAASETNAVWWMIPSDVCVCVCVCFRVRISIVKNSHVTVTVNDNIQVMVLLHRVWKKNPVSVDFLGLYIPHSNQYSPLVHGLIGNVHLHDLKIKTRSNWPHLTGCVCVCVCVMSQVSSPESLKWACTASTRESTPWRRRRPWRWRATSCSSPGTSHMTPG